MPARWSTTTPTTTWAARWPRACRSGSCCGITAATAASPTAHRAAKSTADSDAASGLAVQRPIVRNELHGELHVDRLVAIAVHVRDQALALAVGREIFGVEIENGREPHCACRRIDANVARVVEELPRRGLELRFELVGTERLLRQARATAHHAVQREMHTRLAERPNDVVLVGRQRHRLAAHGDFAQPEKRLSLEKARETVRDALVDDAAHDQRVVGVQVV